MEVAEGLEGECSTWNNFGEGSGMRGGNQKTTLRERKKRGKFKTAVAPRKPTIYRKSPNRISVGNLRGLRKRVLPGICGAGKARNGSGPGRIAGKDGFRSGWIGLGGIGGCGEGWKVGRDCMEFAVWNSRVPVAPWGKGSRGENLQGH